MVAVIRLAFAATLLATACTEPSGDVRLELAAASVPRGTALEVRVANDTRHDVRMDRMFSVIDAATGREVPPAPGELTAPISIMLPPGVTSEPVHVPTTRLTSGAYRVEKHVTYDGAGHTVTATFTVT